MADNDTIDFVGKSGNVYRYWMLASVAADAVQAVAGNYAFLKPNLTGGYTPLYFGESANLKDRLPTHEVWSEAVRLGATLIVAHSKPAGELARKNEERDLIEAWNPVLNVQHKIAR